MSPMGIDVCNFIIAKIYKYVSTLFSILWMKQRVDSFQLLKTLERNEVKVE